MIKQEACGLVSTWSVHSLIPGSPPAGAVEADEAAEILKACGAGMLQPPARPRLSGSNSSAAPTVRIPAVPLSFSDAAGPESMDCVPDAAPGVNGVPIAESHAAGADFVNDPSDQLPGRSRTSARKVRSL